MPFDPFEYPPQPRFTAGVGIVSSVVTGILFGFFAPAPLKWYLLAFPAAMLAISTARYRTNKPTLMSLFERDGD
jgi:hypothetical protein